MLLGVGAVVLALLVIVIVGNLWFHLVESALEYIRRLFDRGKKPQAWHSLPPEQEDRKDTDKVE